MPDLQQKLDTVFTLRRQGDRRDFIRAQYRTLLKRLGNPQRQLPPVIHVAGTNGKGSTIAFMRAILEAAGYRVHVYTSPHLLRFNERIVIAGHQIGDATLEALLDEVMAATEGLDPNFFEIATAIAFLAFSRSPADIVLLETGLGGRLDPTNVVENPIATVITLLSRDHTELLGESIAEIAAEKAGIMKPHAPCLIGSQMSEEVFPILSAAARVADATCLFPGGGWQFSVAPDGMVVQSVDRIVSSLPLPSLSGAHQFANAALAVAALLTQTKLAIPDIAFRQGLTNAVWPARLQPVLSRLLPHGWEMWLDGGHNDSAALMLAAQAKRWTANDGKKLHIITGMMGHKNLAAFVSPLAPLAASVTIIAVPGHREESAPLMALAQLWRDYGSPVTRIETEPWPRALQHIIDTQRQETGRVLITGSLYLAQMVL